MKHTFENGVNYKLKLTFKSRKVTKSFEGMYDPMGDGVKTAYKFGGTGGTIFVTDEHIESFEVVKPKAAKPRTLKTCTRCNGVGHFEHLSHVEGGRCYKCGGYGKV